MSDVQLNFIVEPIESVITVQPNDITISLTEVQLRLFLGGIGVPGGNVNEVQINSGADTLTGAQYLTYSTGVTTAANIVVTNSANLGSVGNITITGGSANYALITNGSGVLSWGDTGNANYANFAGTAFSVAGANVTGTVGNSNYAAYAGNVTLAAQGNITSLGNLLNLTVSNVTGIVNFANTGNVTLGNSVNVHMTGGNNGYFLQTDGTGNLTWAAGGNSTGNGIPGGSNTQIQFNDAGLFGGAAGFTLNNVSNVMTANRIAITGNITAPQFISNIAIGTAPLVVTSTTVVANLTANTALTAQAVSNASQPNITSVGTLTSLEITGTTTLQQVKEKATQSASPTTGVRDYDLLDQAIMIQSAGLTGNIQLNFRGNSSTTLNSMMSSNQSITCTYINYNDTSPYFVDAILIDGVSVSPLYFANTTPIIGSLGRDLYTYNIIKTAGSTYIVIGTFGTLT